VTDRAALLAAAERVKSELGGADILVNNAGVMLLAPFSGEQHDESRQMVEVNLLGAITATEVFLDQLRDGQGDLVNISSVAGRSRSPWQRRLRSHEMGRPTAGQRRCARSCSPAFA
jgi:NADP-dependent 3-hydroxy acid dehydrogenase YdfG